MKRNPWRALLLAALLGLTLSACSNGAQHAPSQSVSSLPTSPTASIPAIQSTKPTEPTEPSMPTEPTEPTEPSMPTEPTEPTEPSMPTEPQPSEHIHSYGQWQTVRSPGCAAPGEQQRVCSCGETETQSLDATGHTQVTDPGTEATCTQEGCTEGKHCSVCGEILVAQTKLDKLAHREVADPAVSATCGTAGLTEGKHCSLCGAVTLAQQPVSPTDQHTIHDGSCTTCGLSLRLCLSRAAKLSELSQIMQNIFSGAEVSNETVMFLDRGDVKALLYPIGAIQSVTSYDGKIVYEEGRDYVVENGMLKITEGSSIPCITSAQYYGVADGMLITKDENGNRVNTYWGDGDGMTKWQVNVTYTHSSAWTGFVQENYLQTYEGLIAKLIAGDDVTVLFYGDSITFGATSSESVGLPPYQPSYPVLFVQALADLFDYRVQFVMTGLNGTRPNPMADYVAGSRGTITYVNTAVGGWTSADGVKNLQKYVLDHTATYGCDLLVLAYGMNDVNIFPLRTKENFRTVANGVLAAHPHASLLLVSTMLPNPNAVNGWYGVQPLQEDPLRELAAEFREGGVPCAVACMTSVSRDILKYKDFEDTTGNNINHPNDFFCRVYAQTLLQTLIGYENMG